MNKNLKDRADNLLSSIYLDGYEHGYKDALQNITNYMHLEPKTGHWIEHPTEEDYSVCSRCGIGTRRMEHGKNADGTTYIDIYSYRFCPYCGARMETEEET